MPDDRHPPADDRRTAVDRMLTERLEEAGAMGRPLSRTAPLSRRTLEDYLKAGLRPRWMERLAEIDRGVAGAKRRLAADQRALREACGDDPERFAREWRARAEGYRFDELNELIRQHNDWYPIERNLPMDPRTRDYVPVHGASHRRPELGPEWVLAHFPPDPA